MSVGVVGWWLLLLLCSSSCVDYAHDGLIKIHLFSRSITHCINRGWWGGKTRRKCCLYDYFAWVLFQYCTVRQGGFLFTPCSAEVNQKIVRSESILCVLFLVHFPVTLHCQFRFCTLKWTRSKTLHWIPALHPFSVPIQVQQLPLNPSLVALRILNHCAVCWCCAIWACLEVAKCLALLGKGAGGREVSWSSTKDGEDGSFNSWAISG